MMCRYRESNNYRFPTVSTVCLVEFVFFTQISSKAKDILRELLPAYPAQDFVLTTLNSLTQLALRSLVDIPDQVTVLVV